MSSLNLEDLLSRAMAKQTPVKTRRKPSDNITAKELAEADRRMKERFTLDSNWERVRTVLLVHQETETVLGNFVELRHKLSTGCRKLQRVNEPTAVEATEYVQGAHWINAPAMQPAKMIEAIAEEIRDALCDLHLPELGNVYSPTVEVSVTLTWGGISRVELTQDTRFFDKDKRTHLILEAGLDVLEVMSLDSKLKLREWLGL